MDGLWEGLAEILEKENVLYRDILELSRHKTGIIVKGKVSELEQLMKVERDMILKAGELEQRRIDEINRLARHFNMPRDEFNITAAIERTSNDDIGKRLMVFRDEISASLRELKEVNDLNGELIEKSLEYIDFSINLVASHDADITYDGKKGKDKGKGGNFFDQKV